MAGDAGADSQFTGMSKHFNAVTIRGRANVSYFTCFFFTYLFYRSLPLNYHVKAFIFC